METIELAGPFGTMPEKPQHPGKGVKLDHVVQLKCGEVHTTLKNIVMDPMVWKYRFGNERYIKQINDILE